MKEHGSTPLVGYGPSKHDLRMAKPCVVKRSYKRALRRIATHGYCWYRGQCLNKADVPPASLNQVISPTQTKRVGRMGPRWTGPLPPNRAHVPMHRIVALVWNPGGLSRSKLQEFLIWAECQSAGLFILPETRWTFDSTWEDAKWLFIHSGSDNGRSSGILIIISKKLCTGNLLSHRNIIPGRLVHLRMHLAPRYLDVLACYQHTGHTGADLDARASFWATLDGTLHSLAQRHGLVVAGDFNCCLTAGYPITGTNVFTHGGRRVLGTQHKDRAMFNQIALTHGLVALNCWDASLGPTSSNPIGAVSRIDFVFLRQKFVDTASRRAILLPEAPFAHDQGAHHTPLLCNLALPSAPTGPTREPMLQLKHRQHGRESRLTGASHWQCFTEDLQQVVDNVLTSQSGATAGHTAGTETLAYSATTFSTASGVSPGSFEAQLESCHAQALQCFCQHFVRPPNMTLRESNPTLDTSLSSLQVVRSKWTHFHAFRKPALITAMNVFKAWWHMTQFTLRQKQHAKIVHSTKLKRVAEVIETAAKAATHHDSYTLFACIRALMPKVDRKIKLRNTHGQLMSTVEEVACFRAHIRTTWQGPDRCPSFGWLTTMPFDKVDLISALAKTPEVKAVAPGRAPGTVWRIQAERIGGWLFDMLCQLWIGRPPVIPQSWKDGWLCYIPKPGKAPSHPSMLRPLALTDPLGKVVMQLVALRVRTQAWSHLVQWPQYAYLPFRSTFDPISRVAQHCRDARNLRGLQQLTQHDRANGLRSPVICGALQVFLDVDKAFDCAPRDQLIHGLLDCGVDEGLATLLGEWHSHTRYHYTHLGVNICEQSGRGVRQGCTGAPMLWAVLIARFLQRLSQTVPQQWIQKCLNIFADDLQGGDTFDDELKLRQCLRYLGQVIDCLEELGLTVNPVKTVAMLQLGGTQRRKWQALLTRRGANGAYLIPPRKNGSMQLKLVSSTVYLGVRISYSAFETYTQTMRANAAQKSVMSLSRWLYSKRRLPFTHRLRLWQTCIVPCAEYGLLAVGITHRVLTKHVTCLMKQLRIITGNQSHVTHDSHLTVLHAFGLEHPIESLRRATQAKLQQHEYHLGFLHPHDIVVAHSRYSLSASLQMIEQFREALYVCSPEEPPVIRRPLGLDCHVCGASFHTVTDLHRHFTRSHHLICPPQRVDYELRAIAGLPQCVFCMQTFATWGTFRQHITQKRCRIRPFETEPHGDVSTSTCIPMGLWRDLIRFDKYDSTAHSVRAPHTITDYFNRLPRAQVMNLSALRTRAAEFARGNQWNALQQDRELCEYLSHHCLKCGRWCTRSRELVVHLREAHPQVIIPGIEQMVALQRTHVRASPCPFCSLSWKQQHGCPILLQTAILQAEMSATSLATDTSSTRAQAPTETVQKTSITWPCHLCSMTFPTRVLLSDHLREHQQQLHRYDPKRDSVEGEPACSHCGLLVTSMDALRYHITKGHCKHFDPRKPVPDVPISPDLKAALLSGRLGPYLREAGARTFLTVQCLCCGRTFPGARELSRRLQERHSILWNDALHLGLSLKHVVSPLTGCICNPAVASMTSKHECVGLRQLAMTHLRLHDDLLVPWVFDHELLQQLLRPGVLPLELVNTVHSWLIDRKFQKLWQCTELIQILSSCCFMCDFRGHGTDLQIHLLVEHHCQERGLMMFVQQILRLLPISTEASPGCWLCGMAREDLRAHLIACPTLIQISSLIALPIHERFWLGVHGGRFHGAIIGGAPRLGPIGSHGKRSGALQEGQTRTKQARSTDSGSRASAARSHSSNGSIDATPRSGSADECNAGYIHSLLGSKPRGQPPTPANGPPTVDRPQGEVHHASNAPDAGTLEGATTQTPEGDGLLRSGLSQSHHGEEWNPAGGSDLAVHTMGSDVQKAPPLQDEEANDDDRSPGTPGRAAHTCQGGGGDPAVSFTEPAGICKEPTMEAAGRATQRPTPSIAHTELPSQPVANCRHSDEASYTEGLALGSEGQGHAPTSLMEEDRVHLAKAVASWELQNPANHCYINASLQALGWATLHRQHFSFDDWGVLHPSWSTEHVEPWFFSVSGPRWRHSALTWLLGMGHDSTMLSNLHCFSCPRWIWPQYTAFGREGMPGRLGL